MGDKARETIMAKFNIDNFIKNWQTMFEEVVGKSSSAITG